MAASESLTVAQTFRILQFGSTENLIPKMNSVPLIRPTSFELGSMVPFPLYTSTGGISFLLTYFDEFFKYKNCVFRVALLAAACWSIALVTSLAVVLDPLVSKLISYNIKGTVSRDS